MAPFPHIVFVLERLTEKSTISIKSAVVLPCCGFNEKNRGNWHFGSACSLFLCSAQVLFWHLNLIRVKPPPASQHYWDWCRLVWSVVNGDVVLWVHTMPHSFNWIHRQSSNSVKGTSELEFFLLVRSREHFPEVRDWSRSPDYSIWTQKSS